MYPHERSLVEEMQGEPFALLGVNSDDLERAKTAIRENNLNWRSFQNSPEGSETQISTTWRVRGWPTIVVLDAEMTIRYRGHRGDKAIDVAKALVEKLKKSDGE